MTDLVIRRIPFLTGAVCRVILLWVPFCLPHAGFSQDNIGYQFGATYREVDMDSYDKDTAAAAVIIREYGERLVISSAEQVYRYHVKYKVLKHAGTNVGNVEVRLRKPRRFQNERIRRVRAASYNIEGPSMVESKLDTKEDLLVTKVSKTHEAHSFHIPNVKVGSVVEYEYEVFSPYVLDFKDWVFQGSYPKMLSEYFISVPLNVTYKITLRGSLDLTSVRNQTVSDCPFFKCQEARYTMRYVPAFVEEDMMPAKADYLSRIEFELTEVNTGSTSVSWARTWRDLDLELHQDKWFEGQMRRGKEIAGVIPGFAKIKRIDNDTLALARGIHKFVRDWFEWDGTKSFYSADIATVFDTKKGDSGDINITLIALLRFAGYQVDPVILSTTEHGQPTDAQPLLGDFNYVLGRIVIGTKEYLVDAVDDLAPFGLIPRYCYNGDGRLIVSVGSKWFSINLTEKNREISVVNLKLDAKGRVAGTMERTYIGYKALERRKEIKRIGKQEYYDKLKTSHAYIVESIEHTGLDSLHEPLVEKWVFTIDPGLETSMGRVQFNPFLTVAIEQNPFKAETRLYPVALGLPIEFKTTVLIEYPAGTEVLAVPEKVGAAMPDGGGRYLLAAEAKDSKLVINEIMSLPRLQYSPAEYPHLKELFTRAIQAQSADVIFKQPK
jgi:hypothetical protein